VNTNPGALFSQHYIFFVFNKWANELVL